MTNKNTLPPFGEQLILPEGTSIQDFLTQFKQQIPTGFIKLELQEGNYICSTNPKWNKPVCERYGFTYNKGWIQIDIPHTFLDKLELKKGKDINKPLYFDPRILERELNYGGVTLESEEEIILVNPNKIVTKEQEAQTEIDSKKIADMESLSEQIAKLEQEKETSQQIINDLQNVINDLKREKAELESNFANDKIEWEKQNVSKTKYDKLEIYSNKQELVIDNLEGRLQQTGMMKPSLQTQLQELPKFKP